MTRVAVVQLDAGRSADDVATRSVAAVEHAADGGAELVILPEYASGWAPRLGPELAVTMDGPFLGALREAAERRGITVVVGVVLPGDAEGIGEAEGVGAAEGAREPRCANRALAISPDGVVLGGYTKVHLFDAFGTRESDALVAGAADAPPLVIDVGGQRFGVMTCYDVRFPEMARRLVDAGADALVVIAAWASGPGKADQLDVLARARALENTTYLLLASQNGAGRTGHSAVVDPLGSVVVRAGADEEAVLFADLDEGRVAEVRSRLPVLVNRRYGVVPLA